MENIAMATLDCKHSPGMKLGEMRRGSDTLKPTVRPSTGLRAHKSSEELRHTGYEINPKYKKGDADLACFLSSPITYSHRNASLGDLPRHSPGVSSSQPHGSPGTHQAAPPIIQVQSASPTLSRRVYSDIMKKTVTDPGKLTHKRRRSPLSKHLASDISNVASGVSSNPRAASSRLGMTVTDIGQHADTSHEEGDNADSGTSVMLVTMASNGGSASDATGEGEDFHDGAMNQAPVDENRKRQTIEQLKKKIEKTNRLINDEQNAKEEHVNEYLRLSANADKQQLQRIKTIFEKKNQKSAQTLAALQKKVEAYKKKITEVEQYGVSSHKQPKEVLKDVGQGLKGFFARDSATIGQRSRDSSPSNVTRDMGANIKEFSGGVVDNIRGAKESMISKPKDFAHGLFKNKKYGSADNIHIIKLEESQGSTDDGDKRSHHGSGIIPPKHHTLPTNLTAPRFTEFASEEDAASDATSESAVSGTQSSPHATLQMSANTAQLETLRIAQYAEHLSKELEEQKEITVNLQTAIHDLKTDFQDQFALLQHNLDEERERRERLEEQINDLMELHQNEVPNIRQDLASMEEKMEYKLEERTLDLQELLESCQTRISKMEMQQQQQQLISMEGIDNSNFRALIVKLLNVVLAVVGVVLVFVSTLANVLGPFLTTRVRILSTIAVIAGIVATWQHWYSVRDFGHYYYERYSHIMPFL